MSYSLKSFLWASYWVYFLDNEVYSMTLSTRMVLGNSSLSNAALMRSLVLSAAMRQIEMCSLVFIE